MNTNLDVYRQKASELTFLLALVYATFLYPFPTQLPKYLLILFSLITIGLNYKKSLSREGLLDFWIFFRPWIPWLTSVVVLSFIYGTGGFSRYLNTFLILILLYCAIKWTQFSKVYLLYFLSISSIVISVAITGYICTQGLSDSIFDYNKNKLMYPVTMVAVCCLVALLFDRDNLPLNLRNLLFVAVIVSIVTLSMSEVRGALLGYLSLIPIVLLYSRTLPKKVLLGFLILLAIAIGLFLISGRLQAGFKDLQEAATGDMQSSWGIRLVLWKTSIESFFASPLFGWGPGTYRAYCASGLMMTPLPEFINFTHFHSDFFQLLSFGGLVMIVGWGLTCGSLIWNAMQDPYRLSLLFSSLAMGLTEPCWTRWLSLFSLAILWILFTLATSDEPAEK